MNDDFQAISASASPEVPANENYQSLNYSFVYGKRQPVTSGLVWGFYGGRWGGFEITAGTLTLADNNDNYIVVNKSTGAISVESTDSSPPAPINWADTANYARVYKITTLAGVVTNVDDHRAGPDGVGGGGAAATPGSGNVGYLNVPQNSKSADYTTVLADSGKHIFHPSSDNNPRTFTIDSNANVAYPLGTCLTFVNKINTVTVAITSDTLTLAGAGTTGSRTLAANGMATAIKIATTEWMISGSGIT